MLSLLMVARILPKLLSRGTGLLLPLGAEAIKASADHSGLLFVSNPSKVSLYQVATPMVVRRADPSGPNEIQPLLALQAGSIPVKRS